MGKPLQGTRARDAAAAAAAAAMMTQIQAAAAKPGTPGTGLVMMMEE